MPTDQKRLEQLIRSRHPCIQVVTQEEHHALELLNAAVLGSSEALWLWSVTRGIWPGLFEDTSPLPNTENPAAALYHIANQLNHPLIAAMLDLGCHLDDERTARAARDAIHKCRQSGSCLILIDSECQLPGILAAEATRLDLALPDAAELERIIRNTIRRLSQHKNVQAKLSKRDLQTIVRNLSGLTRRQAEQIVIDSIVDDQCFGADDINAILAYKRRRMQHDGVLEYIEAPIDLKEIGGLTGLKKWLHNRRDSLSEDALAFGITPPRGVLLLGVQGAGKSLSAKAIATAWQRPLLRLDPGALYDRFVGESERRLRDALRQAEMMAPIVLWIDEIEKGFASAASHSTDGGLSQRMFGTLLTWMQEHRSPVFLVATANNIDVLPPELLRRGRFDEIFFVDLPANHVRRQIFSIHLSKRKRDPEKFDLDELAQASEGFSGAEIEQAIIAALHEAFSDKAEIDTPRLAATIKRSPPLSVTMAERVADLREWAVNRCVPAD